MSNGVVYMLVLLGYNSIGGEITMHKEMSWHASLSECNEIMWAEKTDGRKERFNQRYFCMPVVDHEKAAELRNARRDDYPRRHGSNPRLILQR